MTPIPDDKRRAAAAQSEACVDIAALADEISANAASLDERWRMAQWLIEQLRQQLFDADVLRRAVATANSQFDAAGVANLKINLTAIRRAANRESRADKGKCAHGQPRPRPRSENLPEMPPTGAPSAGRG
ncbi:MAG: hypothetical protein E5V27_09615, partial [Mesorhizobium sp.]